MLHKKDLLLNEISLKEDECCIIFDFGCYFPYVEKEILTFDFSLGMEKFSDYKINHRYPNKQYQTISRKYGRRVSKLGYPYLLKLEEQSPMLLSLNIGIKEKIITLIFPIDTNMTKEKPISLLEFRYDFEKHQFIFTTSKRKEDGFIKRLSYLSKEEMKKNIGQEIILNPPERMENSNKLLFNEFIIPYPFSINE